MESSALNIPGVFRLGETRQKPDQAFPLGLGREGVHEICEGQHGDMAAMTGFALAAAQPPAGAVIWVRQYGLTREHGHLLHAGLKAVTKPVTGVLSVDTRKATDALWATEEAICSGAAGLVIAEVAGLDFTASRRLTLSASRHGVPVILLLPWRRDGTSAAMWARSLRRSA